MSKEEILGHVKEAGYVSARNSMGCNESWYNPYYAMQQTFTEEELEGFDETTLNALYKLGEKLSEAFY